MLLYLNMCAQITSENNNNCFLLIITDSFTCLKLRPNNGIVVPKRVGVFSTLTIHIIWFDLIYRTVNIHQVSKILVRDIKTSRKLQSILDHPGYRGHRRGGGGTAVYSLLLVSSREVNSLASGRWALNHCLGRQRALCSLLAAVKCA